MDDCCNGCGEMCQGCGEMCQGCDCNCFEGWRPIDFLICTWIIRDTKWDCCQTKYTKVRREPEKKNQENENQDNKEGAQTALESPPLLNMTRIKF